MLSCGIIGLPTVGKTTLFNLLTLAEAEISKVFSGKAKSNQGVARIPDPRIDFLAKMYQPRKTTYAQLEVVDVPGLVRGSSKGKGVGNRFLDDIRKTDALIHIVRAFHNPEVLHVDDTIDPLRDIDTVNTELVLADLQVVENRLARLGNSRKITPENKQELEILEKIREVLENGDFVYNMKFAKEEFELLKSFGFITAKPVLIVVNLDEDQYREGTYPGAAGLRKLCLQKNTPLLEISCKLEMEIAQLDSEDQEALLHEYRIEETGISRLARATYDYLGLISFFTVGEDEVRAWTIARKTNARKAAGKIHSDLEKGFIKAEVVKYHDLIKLGSMATVKENGLFKLEGKDYLVQDSDIINFRFNVS